MEMITFSLRLQFEVLIRIWLQLKIPEVDKELTHALLSLWPKQKAAQ